MDSSSVLNCLVPSVSSHQTLRNSSISWQFLARLSWKILFVISNSPHKLSFLFEPDLPINSPGTAPTFEIRVIDWFHEGQCQNFLVPIFSCSCLLQPQIVVSELRIVLERPIQLSARARHADFSFQTEFAHFPDLDLFCLSTTFVQHLHLTHHLAPISWRPANLRRGMDLSRLMMLAAGYRLLPLAAGNQRHSRGWSLLLAPKITVVKSNVPLLHIRGSRGCDCGGKVIVLDVEAVSPRGVVYRRVLTADVDAGLELVTCERSGFSQMAKLHLCWRSGARVLLIPVISSAVGVEGGGVDQKDGNGSGKKRGVVDETCCEWMTFSS